MLPSLSGLIPGLEADKREKSWKDLGAHTNTAVSDLKDLAERGQKRAESEGLTKSYGTEAAKKGAMLAHETGRDNKETQRLATEANIGAGSSSMANQMGAIMAMADQGQLGDLGNKLKDPKTRDEAMK